ncbi:MAG: cyclopropane-fatty-acyl-phospholipid synthase family protein [Candidatus Latescibacterota bacterium]|nr:cyclopropane-fatty-acyl-phospholipid synthase family protein [Candidatus Latescibacterota bacterium]
MVQPKGRALSPAAQISISLLEEIFGGIECRRFAVRLWDDTVWGQNPSEPLPASLVLRHPGALRRVFLKPSEVNFAECYIHDDVDMEGDIADFLSVGDILLNQKISLTKKASLARHLLKLPVKDERDHTDHDGGRPKLFGVEHSMERDKKAVTHHYDLSNEFYRLWLDRNMVYSCAYFASPAEDLDSAQVRKLDFLCRKLRLQRGEKLLDIGCGWGGLIRHAVRNYGVEALGITLSQPQADLANERIHADGLADRCRVEMLDYRDLNRPEGFDKIVSVGMVEHVGRDRMDEYFGTMYRLLKRGGAFLNHGIGDLSDRPLKKKKGFIRTYVFPDSDLPSLPEIFRTAEAHHFEGRDMESLREHYALTLRHWVQRLEDRREEAISEVGEATYRAWRLYMAGCAWWFSNGHISIYQSLFVKQAANGESGVPLMRSDWYDARPTTLSLHSVAGG